MHNIALKRELKLHLKQHTRLVEIENVYNIQKEGI